MKKIEILKDSEIESTSQDIMVSVIVTTFNHGKFLCDCLDSVLSQVCNFRIEIVIHDDASEDNTQDIIREYQKEYPSQIVALLQKANIYSQGYSIHNEYMPYVRGKYIATCEGDDYWLNTDKLQKQIQFLEENPSYIAFYHRALVVDIENKPLGWYYPNENKDVTYTKLGGGIRLPGQTATKVYRNIWNFIPDEMLTDYELIPEPGDVKIAQLLSCMGKIFYSHEVMSAYRYVINGGSSWSARTRKVNRTEDVYKRDVLLNVFTEKYYNLTIIDECSKLDLLWYSFSFWIRSRKQEDFATYQHCRKIFSEISNMQLLKFYIKKSVSFITRKISIIHNIKKIHAD